MLTFQCPGTTDINSWKLSVGEWGTGGPILIGVVWVLDKLEVCDTLEISSLFSPALLRVKQTEAVPFIPGSAGLWCDYSAGADSFAVAWIDATYSLGE